MVLSLIAGIAFAAGHHLFYLHLDGSPINDEGHELAGWELSDQQLNIAVGTAFAFLVKASLVTAMTAAYVQLFWKMIRTEDYTERVTLGGIDRSAAALRDVLALCHPTFALRFPLLAIFALFTWMIPLASIMTPATLVVRTASVTRLVNVPILDYNTFNFLAPIGLVGYNGPSKEVERIVFAAAARGEIFPIDSPGSSATWTIEFLGPSLKCGSVNGTERLQMLESIRNYTAEAGNCVHPRGYISWAGVNQLPYVVGFDGLLTLPSEYYGPLHVAILPRMLQLDVVEGQTTIPEACKFEQSTPAYANYSLQTIESYWQNHPLGKLGEGATILTCDPYNVTYSVDFNFDNGRQQVAVRTSEPHNDLSAYYNFKGIRPFENCTENEYVSCERDRNILARLSHQAVLDAFKSILSGAGQITTGFAPLRLEFTSNVRSTILTLTPEFQNLERLKFVSGIEAAHTFLEDRLIANNTEMTDHLQDAKRARNEAEFGALQSTIEELMQNVTVSLLSSPSLRHRNMSAPWAPPPTNVTFGDYHNIYEYSAGKLWLGYGVAIAVATLAVIWGFSITWSSGAFYSNNFSTIFLAAQNADIDHDTAYNSGQSPLPKYLSRASVRFDQMPSPDENDREDPKQATARTTLLRAVTDEVQGRTGHAICKDSQDAAASTPRPSLARTVTHERDYAPSPLTEGASEGTASTPHSLLFRNLSEEGNPGPRSGDYGHYGSR